MTSDLLRCSKCQEFKAPDQFAKSSNKRGYHYYCRQCDTKRHFEKYQSDPEPQKASSRRWAENHPDRKLASWHRSQQKFIARGRIRRNRVGAPTKEELDAESSK